MDEFKFNSQVCTPKNQSERLLKLGLKKETADMYYSTILENDDIARVCWEDFWASSKAMDGYIRRRCIPAWSLHRLIELIDEPEHIARWIGVQIANDYDYTVGCIEWLIKEGYFNKAYLEE